MGARLILDLSQWSESNSCWKNFCQLPKALALAQLATRGCQGIHVIYLTAKYTARILPAGLSHPPNSLEGQEKFIDQSSKIVTIFAYSE
jgi:hypothetical protein